MAPAGAQVAGPAGPAIGLRVDVAVFDAAKDWREGRAAGGVRELGLKDGGVDYVYDEKNKALIPDAVRAKVEALRERIAKGEIKVPRS